VGAIANAYTQIYRQNVSMPPLTGLGTSGEAAVSTKMSPATGLWAVARQS
jgi:hypothetical protein